MKSAEEKQLLDQLREIENALRKHGWHILRSAMKYEDDHHGEFATSLVTDCKPGDSKLDLVFADTVRDLVVSWNNYRHPGGTELRWARVSKKKPVS